MFSVLFVPTVHVQLYVGFRHFEILAFSLCTKETSTNSNSKRSSLYRPKIQLVETSKYHLRFGLVFGLTQILSQQLAEICAICKIKIFSC